MFGTQTKAKCTHVLSQKHTIYLPFSLNRLPNLRLSSSHSRARSLTFTFARASTSREPRQVMIFLPSEWMCVCVCLHFKCRHTRWQHQGKVLGTVKLVNILYHLLLPAGRNASDSDRAETSIEIALKHRLTNCNTTLEITFDATDGNYLHKLFSTVCITRFWREQCAPSGVSTKEVCGRFMKDRVCLWWNY